MDFGDFMWILWAFEKKKMLRVSKINGIEFFAGFLHYLFICLSKKKCVRNSAFNFLLIFVVSYVAR